MRFAVLTRAHTAYGVELLQRLQAAALQPTCIGVEQLQWQARWRMARLLARRTSVANALWHNAWIGCRSVKARLRPGSNHTPYSLFCPSVAVTTDMNSARMIEFLRSHQLDLIVLGHSGIVRESILTLPSVGTLNAHPARLPAFRGVDVVRWALLSRQSIAATLHWVDRGVDTGDIIAVRNVLVQANDSVDQVEQRAIDTSLDLLVWGIRELDSGRALSGESQSLADGKQYHLMPPWTRLRLRRRWPQLRHALVDTASRADTAP